MSEWLSAVLLWNVNVILQIKPLKLSTAVQNLSYKQCIHKYIWSYFKYLVLRSMTWKYRVSNEMSRMSDSNGFEVWKLVLHLPCRDSNDESLVNI